MEIINEPAKCIKSNLYYEYGIFSCKIYRFHNEWELDIADYINLSYLNFNIIKKQACGKFII